MSTVYLIRHGQAGARDNYDLLSELGQKQAQLLGQYLVEQEVCPQVIYVGGMRRQKETAESVCAAFRQAGIAVPEVMSDEQWNEFSLASLYEAFAPRLCKESREFAADYALMREQLQSDPHATRGAAGRCDAMIVRSWIEKRYEYGGEDWEGFRARVESRIAHLAQHAEDDQVLVFTSATPISILTAAALELSLEKLFSLLGVLYNSSLTTLRVNEGMLRLFSYNATPHLPSQLHTFR